jgi:hypothetical protein
MWPFKRRRDDDFHSEIEAHLRIEIDRLIEEGLSPEEAHRAARRAFGNVTAARERYYETGRMRWLDDLRQDARYSLRMLKRSPGFASIAALTLAIGIGANTTIFSIVNAVLLRPLPYADPDSLVLLEPSPVMLTPRSVVAAWQSRGKSLVDLAGFNGPRAGNAFIGGEPRQIDFAAVTANFLSFLGAPPAVGRDFTAD